MQKGKTDTCLAKYAQDERLLLSSVQLNMLQDPGLLQMRALLDSCAAE